MNSLGGPRHDLLFVTPVAPFNAELSIMSMGQGQFHLKPTLTAQDSVGSFPAQTTLSRPGSGHYLTPALDPSHNTQQVTSSMNHSPSRLKLKASYQIKASNSGLARHSLKSQSRSRAATSGGVNTTKHAKGKTERESNKLQHPLLQPKDSVENWQSQNHNGTPMSFPNQSIIL